MRERRFKVETVDSPRITITGPQGLHAVRVLRLDVADEVVLFDGRGREVDGRITAVSGIRIDVEVTSEIRSQPLSKATLTLAVATPKGARADWLVEKCAELGVHRLWWLTTERGIVMPGEGKLSRWRRKAVEAAKQARQARIMEIEAPRRLAELFERKREDLTVYYGDPNSPGDEPDEFEPRPFIEMLEDNAGDIMMLIGPEGGFTSEERDQIAGFGGKPVRLANSVLRIETAAIAAASIWAGWRR